MDTVIPLDTMISLGRCNDYCYRSWVCFDWSEVTSDDQSKHSYGKLTFGRLHAVSTYVCIVYSTCMCMYLQCNVGDEFDCISLCEMNVGQR